MRRLLLMRGGVGWRPGVGHIGTVLQDFDLTVGSFMTLGWNWFTSCLEPTSSIDDSPRVRRVTEHHHWRHWRFAGLLENRSRGFGRELADPGGRSGACCQIRIIRFN